MKHSFSTTAILLLTFLCAQIVGLTIVDQYIVNESLYLVEPPHIEKQEFSFIPIIIGVLIATGIILLLARFKLYKIWSLWYGLSITVALSFALYPFFSKIPFAFHALTSMLLFMILVISLAAMKLFWRNAVFSNVIEIFVYGGIIAIIIPLVNVVSASILLVVISLYDCYAVWKSKHMVTLAEFQKDSGVFAGLHFGGEAHKSEKHAHVVHKSGKTKNARLTQAQSAILGGGDIALPLLFSATLLKIPGIALWQAFLPSVGACLGLLVLFIIAKPKRYYPAMPFVSAGVFLFFGLLLLIV